MAAFTNVLIVYMKHQLEMGFFHNPLVHLLGVSVVCTTGLATIRMCESPQPKEE